LKTNFLQPITPNPFTNMLTLVPKSNPSAVSNPAPQFAVRTSVKLAASHPLVAELSWAGTSAPAGLDLDAERLEFEGRVLTQVGMHADTILQRKPNGNYQDPMTQAAFSGWALAKGLGQQPAVVPSAPFEFVDMPDWDVIRARQTNAT
jgi:hypothetical protein